MKRKRTSRQLRAKRVIAFDLNLSARDARVVLYDLIQMATVSRSVVYRESVARTWNALSSDGSFCPQTECVAPG